MGKLYSSKYYHRDLSWLRFNHRVLQEAADTRNPLYERIKFLAIFSSNLDEFFKVRVSDIRQAKKIEKPLRKKLISKPNKVLREIKKQVDIQQEEFGEIFTSEIILELAKENIFLINHTKFNSTQKLAAQNYYEDVLKEILEIQVYNVSENNTISIENESLYLISQTAKNKIAFVKIPESVGRFFVFPKQSEKHHITFIDDILKYTLKQTPQLERDLSFYAIKLSKDAELYIEDEISGNLMQKIKEALPKRNTGQATRVLMDKTTPKSLIELVYKALDINETDTILGGIYHNFKDFFRFPNPTLKKLEQEPLPPLSHPLLLSNKSVFETVREKDQLLHFPYQSFEPVIKLLEEAAVDSLVSTIKITIYRAAKKSRLNDAIVTAAKNGKKVIVFIEAKARFDEENNLYWGAKFKENGATVIYSYPDIKVHSKIMYIERKIDNSKVGFAYIGTGNFNEKTAKLYTDFGLLTTKKKITKEINNVFLVLQGKTIVPKNKRVLVSPFTSRFRFSEMIQTEILQANEGKKAKITLKMNSLQDKEMIRLLYKASNAGVEIRLLIRGICCLVPGIKNQSENIYITSILDRYLEHGRIYIFENGGEEKIYIGSADWMTRNLSHRIEVIAPVLDEDHKKTIKDLIELQINDTVKARIIDAEQSNKYVAKNGENIQSQIETYNYFKTKNPE
ncbi:polyphosphate kinase 1 [Patiriisocius hiemis]|uniref:Polyphosphate kinase n=1 Tax=Patiriisocius hiemis TaxID=3075604 RepID=A0ABU2YDJ5_9FLAO|nr:polyphosphate kinase 1 [Constantimarinum sp. W242]MDT0555870.1 polyphosphate kinase 1 [Constantimarinum sp. W242]